MAVSDAQLFALTLGVVVVLLSSAIDFDFSGIPVERLTLIGDNTPIPWHTLLTGISSSRFLLGTNRLITQRAMAWPTVDEAKRVCSQLLPFAWLSFRRSWSYRGLSLPSCMVISVMLRSVGSSVMLPLWLSGAFAAAIAAAVLTSVNSVLNSSTTLWFAISRPYNASADLKRLNLVIVMSSLGWRWFPSTPQQTALLTCSGSYFLYADTIGVYCGPAVQRCCGGCRHHCGGTGVILYGFFSPVWAPLLHHMMFSTVIFCMSALTVSRIVFRTRIRPGHSP